MEAARTSEPLVDLKLRPRQYIPEDSELQNSTYFQYPEKVSKFSDIAVKSPCERHL
jgi:hypothetical protein